MSNRNNRKGGRIKYTKGQKKGNSDPAGIHLSKAIISYRQQLPPEPEYAIHHPGEELADKLNEERFHNPYHFIPVLKAAAQGEAAGLSKEAFDARRLGHYTHARYVPNDKNDKPTYSGRIICTLKTEDYLFIGNTRTEGSDTTTSKADAFELDGEAAIPATSLRGMLSSLAEAASNSALRVLHDGLLSYRQPADPAHSLSALGMIVEQKDEEGVSQWTLRPLTLPTLSVQQGVHPKTYTIPSSFQKLFPNEPWRQLKIYIDGYDRNTRQPLGFLANNADLSSYPESGFYYLRLESYWKGQTGNRFITNDLSLRFSSKDPQKNALLGQTQEPGSKILSEAQWQQLTLAEQKEYTRGLIRILGVTSDRDDIPKTKIHELFIPYAETHEQTAPLKVITPQAIERFNRLADERYEATKKKADPLKPEQLHPYHPLGTKRNTRNNEEDQTLRLKNGDIVYFRPSDDGETIEEVAYSSIWRSAVQDKQKNIASVHAFFDSELRPFHSERQRISPAELLFGFIQDEKNQRAAAFAGRVRVSFGRLLSGYDNVFSDYTFTSKILDSPKPPSPALYFKGDQGYIAKTKLTPETASAHGRKYYLHRHKLDEWPWQTRATKEPKPVPNLNTQNSKQKVEFNPIRAGVTFYFHLDFDCISEWELGLLCYALRPNDSFRHKLGMAKSIGMGKVCIDPVGLFLIDRQLRYRTETPFQSPRYHHCWVAPDSVSRWPDHYKAEQTVANDEACMPCREWQDFRAQFAATMHEEVQVALELLGDPDNVEQLVHTPLTTKKGSREEETYRWFVANDSGSGSGSNKIPAGRQYLKPLYEHYKDPARTTKLPTLEKMRHKDDEK